MDCSIGRRLAVFTPTASASRKGSLRYGCHSGSDGSRLLPLPPSAFAPPTTAIRADPFRERLAETTTLRERHGGRLHDGWRL